MSCSPCGTSNGRCSPVDDPPMDRPELYFIPKFPRSGSGGKPNRTWRACKSMWIFSKLSPKPTYLTTAQTHHNLNLPRFRRPYGLVAIAVSRGHRRWSGNRPGDDGPICGQSKWISSFGDRSRALSSRSLNHYTESTLSVRHNPLHACPDEGFTPQPKINTID